MRFNTIFPTLIIAGSLLLVSCNSKSKEKTVVPATDTSAAAKPEPVQEPSKPVVDGNQENYVYGYGGSSVLTGTITKEMFYGPPGFGENPKTDKQEPSFLLVLEKPIKVIASNEQLNEGTEETRENVDKMQLIWPDGIDMQKYLGKKVKLTGSLFGAHTGHHHTAVLMDMQTIEEL